MTSRKRFVIGCSVPWLFVAGWGIGEIHAINAGLAFNYHLLNVSFILLFAEMVAVALYVCMPMIAGWFCTWIAKHYEMFQRLADYSAALKYESFLYGSYHGLYKKGVRVYKQTFRQEKNNGTKSKAVKHS